MTTITLQGDPDSKTLTGFRGWTSSLSSGFQQLGWVKTSDTGQIDWPNITLPPPNTYAGYEVWAMTDTLSSEINGKLLLKVEYGASSGFSPQINLTMGRTTNGAGGVLEPCIQQVISAPFFTPSNFFDLSEKTGDTISNTLKTITGTISNCPWIQGRTPDKMALQCTTQTNSKITISPEVRLGDKCTLGAWFLWPQPPAGSGVWHTLFRSISGGDHHIIHNETDLGIYHGGFLACGFKMQTLTPGWHHIIATGENGKTIFYIDGQPVGTVPSYHTKEPIGVIGNYQGGTQVWGTLGEIIIDTQRAFSASKVLDLYKGLLDPVVTTMLFSGGRGSLTASFWDTVVFSISRTREQLTLKETTEGGVLIGGGNVNILSGDYEYTYPMTGYALPRYTIKPNAEAVPVMTSNTDPTGWVASSASNHSTTLPYRGFTQKSAAGTGAIVANGTGLPWWLQIQGPAPFTIDSYSIIPWSHDTWPARCMTSWYLSGSPDGSTWITLDTRTFPGGDWVRWTPTQFILAKQAYYRYYRLTITGSNGDSSYIGLNILSLEATTGDKENILCPIRTIGGGQHFPNPNMVLYDSNDLTPNSLTTVDVDGVEHTYLPTKIESGSPLPAYPTQIAVLWE